MMADKKPHGSLIIVGTGISAVSHLTIEARTRIEHADKLFYLVSDPTTEHYLKRLNTTAESLHRFYETGKERFVSYLEMVAHILSAVRQGKKVCAAFYGHPGVFTFPSHKAIEQAHGEGFEAKMIPGISAEDCLFADLGVDPAWSGCQSFEATDFLLFKRTFDVNSSLVLWQVGVIGDVSFQESGYDLSGLHVLAEYLCGFYGADHKTIVYEASHYNFCDPMKEVVTLSQLPQAPITAVSTLYVPPKGLSPMDEVMAARIGMSKDSVKKVTMKVFPD